MTEDPGSHPLKDLDERLKRLRGETVPLAPEPSAGKPETGLGTAFAVAAYLVAGLAVGAAIGWLLDAWLHTRPWLFVVFFFLGGASGILNVYRMVSGMGTTMGYRPAANNKDTGPHAQESLSQGGGKRDNDGRG
jgi:ATP synthase protein I